MSFEYTQHWHDKLIELYRNADGPEDDSQILELVSLAHGARDVRAVHTLIECTHISIPGVDESVYQTLGTIDFPIFYQGLFEVTPGYLNDEDGIAEINYLLQWYGRQLKESELKQVVLPLAKKLLSVSDMEKLVKDMQELGQHKDKSEVQYHFYQFFKKVIDAN